ncbi:MAG: YraN family protein [Firmicutes bacterium]|nr:YraN family protein [Bacillota bacterium]
MNFGQWGEELACNYLRRNGYEILERNFRCRTGELDIIAVKGSVLCFVEVKSRRGTLHGWPSEAVTPQKQKHLKGAALYYLHSHPGDQIRDLRMDVIEVLRVDRRNYIRHIKNAF